jgi:hypothetical protein
MEKEKICDWCGEKVDEQSEYQVSETNNKILCEACSIMMPLDTLICELCSAFENPEEIISFANITEKDGSITKYKMTITKVV